MPRRKDMGILPVIDNHPGLKARVLSSPARRLKTFGLSCLAGRGTIYSVDST
jgi:hypothetical protein